MSKFTNVFIRGLKLVRLQITCILFSIILRIFFSKKKNYLYNQKKTVKLFVFCKTRGQLVTCLNS